MVRTPTLCKPDTSDRPCYFLFNLINLATPLTTYAVCLVLLIFVNHHSRAGSSAPHNNHTHHYNPRADETDYDDYETPEIGDIHGDEVYNNIN
jgi:hypothetical protein